MPCEENSNHGRNLLDEMMVRWNAAKGRSMESDGAPPLSIGHIGNFPADASSSLLVVYTLMLASTSDGGMDV